MTRVTHAGVSPILSVRPIENTTTMTLPRVSSPFKPLTGPLGEKKKKSVEGVVGGLDFAGTKRFGDTNNHNSHGLHQFESVTCPELDPHIPFPVNLTKACYPRPMHETLQINPQLTWIRFEQGPETVLVFGSMALTILYLGPQLRGSFNFIVLAISQKTPGRKLAAAITATICYGTHGEPKPMAGSNYIIPVNRGKLISTVSQISFRLLPRN